MKLTHAEHVLALKHQTLRAYHTAAENVYKALEELKEVMKRPEFSVLIEDPDFIMDHDGGYGVYDYYGAFIEDLAEQAKYIEEQG